MRRALNYGLIMVFIISHSATCYVLSAADQWGLVTLWFCGGLFVAFWWGDCLNAAAWRRRVTAQGQRT